VFGSVKLPPRSVCFVIVFLLFLFSRLAFMMSTDG
jgi:hypothetical protein